LRSLRTRRSNTEIQSLALGFRSPFASEEMNLLAHAPKLFLLLQEPNLIHVRQIHSVQIAPGSADPGHQSDQNARVRGSLGVGLHRGAVDEALLKIIQTLLDNKTQLHLMNQATGLVPHRIEVIAQGAGRR
jgi:hypothetical protein